MQLQASKQITLYFDCETRFHMDYYLYSVICYDLLRFITRHRQYIHIYSKIKLCIGTAQSSYIGYHIGPLETPPLV